jgi:hypothetical protein
VDGGDMKELFSVECIGTIPGRGLLLSPGVERDNPVACGEWLALIRPDGSAIYVEALGAYQFCETVGGRLGDRKMLDLLIPATTVTKADIPMGTSVWRRADYEQWQNRMRASD